MTAPHVVVDLDATLDEFHDVLEEMEPDDDEVNLETVKTINMTLML